MATHKKEEKDDSKPKTFAESAPDNIPQVDEQVGPGGNKEPDLEDYEGRYKRKSDGELYALALDPTNSLGRTHKATNTLHFWEGTEDQFRKEFTEEDGTPVKDSSKESKKKSKKK